MTTKDDPAEMLKQIVMESHLMIKLTAITAEEEPHSTIAAFLIGPERDCDYIHAGDSRVYHFRGPDLVTRTTDHSYVQRLISEGKITEEQANTHPQGNLLTGCLGTQNDPRRPSPSWLYLARCLAPLQPCCAANGRRMQAPTRQSATRHSL